MANEIKCPKCGEVFQVDESVYAEILRDVRNEEFERELLAREEHLKTEHELRLNGMKLQFEKELAEKTMSEKAAATDKEKQIESLKSELKLRDAEYNLRHNEAIGEKEREIIELKSQIDTARREHKLLEETMKNEHSYALKQKDEMIEYYKDMKLKASTKMLGESLEQHCEISFNQLRHTGFKNAYFRKDIGARAMKAKV